MRSAAKYRPLQQDFTRPLLRFYVTKHLQMNTFEYVTVGMNTDRAVFAVMLAHFQSDVFLCSQGPKGQILCLKIMSNFITNS